MSLMDENIKRLATRNPSLTSRILSVTVSDDYRVVTSRSGLPVIIVRGKALHSLYDPAVEAKRWVDSYEETLKSAQSGVVVLGFGMGYHVMELLKRYYCTLSLYEPDLMALRSAFETIDMKEVIEGGDFIGDDDTHTTLQEFPDEGLLHYRPSISVNPGRYDAFRPAKALATPCQHIVIIGEDDEGVKCRRFFEKYGFTVHSIVSLTEETIDYASLAGADRPVILAIRDVAVGRAVTEKLRSKGVPEGSIIQGEALYSFEVEQLIDLLSFNNIAVPNEYVKALLGAYPESGSNPLLTLAAYQALKIKGALDSSKKTLGVFYPSCAYRANLGSDEMYNKIRRQGYNVVLLFGAICNDEFEKRPDSYYAGHGIVRLLDYIDLFFFPTLTNLLPERAKKALIVHDIWDSPRGKAEAPVAAPDGTLSTSPLLDELDFTFLPATSVMPDDNAPQHKRKKPLCRIPGGYMKLDRNIEYMKSSVLAVDSIVYAPTVINDNFAEYVSMPGFGEKIIGALLKNFPDYRIIFRPHPHTLASEYVAMIVERYSRNSLFAFDGNASFYMDNYCRSALMVSDMSGTAFTYAFTTLRPVVFFSHDEANVEAAFDGVAYFKDRSKIGYVATNIDELVAMVSSGLKQDRLFAEKIQEFRDATMFNVGRVEEYLAENVSYIMEDKRHPHWQYVKGLAITREGGG